MTIWSAVATSTEKFGTRQEGRDINGGPTAQVTLQCDYADRNILASDLITNSVWPFTELGKYAPPVQNISIVPLNEKCDTTEQSIDYLTAELTVRYGTDNSGGSGGGGGGGTGRNRYVETFEPELEIISLQERAYYYKWDAGNIPIGKKNFPHFREYTFNIQRTYYNWISLPTSFKDLVGYCNEAEETFPTLGLTFEIEQLLFVPQNATRTISSEGTEGFTVSVKFKYKKEGWNKFPSAGGNYETVYYEDEEGNEQVLIAHPAGDFSDWIF